MLPLTSDELRRIHDSALRRLRACDAENVVAVGFGRALKAGRFDPKRATCLCIYVKRKRRRVSARRRLPSQITVRWRRGATLMAHTFPTDILEVGKLRAAARPSLAQGDAFVVGIRVRWRRVRSRMVESAWLTVGHPFYGSTVREAARIAWPWRVLLRSRRGSRFDAALLENPGEGSVGDNAGDARHLPVVTLEALRDLPGAEGELVAESRRGEIRFQAYLPRLEVPGVGRLVHVVSALGDRGTFEPGVSGASWLVGGLPAAMQVAAVASLFELGFGQALTSTLVWAEQALSLRAPNRRVLGPVEVMGVE